jgi:hypothetical protein
LNFFLPHLVLDYVTHPHQGKTRMKNIIALGLVFSFGLSLVATTSAEARGWGFHRRGINARQARQQQRLYNGAQNGSLTGREYRHLEGREAKLQAYETKQRLDGGGLSRRERAQIEHREDRLSRNIYHQKHDGQTR